MYLAFSSSTDPGSRQGNEDCLRTSAQNGADLTADGASAFFVLADGLGGHASGEVASGIAVAEALAAYEDEPQAPGLLAACFERGQEQILLRQEQDGATSGMKSTMVVLHIGAGLAQWGHIGDSRLYWFVKGRLRQRTLDHSVPQMLAATGEIREQDIRHHEDRNRLVKVMGIEWPTPRYELSQAVSLSGNDSFLLATDGFWEYLDERAMERSLRFARSPEQWLKRMLAITEKNARGYDRDNYTAIAVFVRGK